MAAEGGQVDMLRWLREQNPPCPWSEDTCEAAVREGHLSTLQWLREQDPPCPWDRRTLSGQLNGHDVVQWALRNGCPKSFSGDNFIY